MLVTSFEQLRIRYEPDRGEVGRMPDYFSGVRHQTVLCFWRFHHYIKYSDLLLERTGVGLCLHAWFGSNIPKQNVTTSQFEDPLRPKFRIQSLF